MCPKTQQQRFLPVTFRSGRPLFLTWHILQHLIPIASDGHCNEQTYFHVDPFKVSWSFLLGKTERLKLFNIPQHRSSHSEAYHQIHVGALQQLIDIEWMRFSPKSWGFLSDAMQRPSWSTSCGKSNTLPRLTQVLQLVPGGAEIYMMKAARELIGP